MVMVWKRVWQPTPVFCPGESMDRGAWQATIHRVTKSQTQLKRLSTQAHTQLWLFKGSFSWFLLMWMVDFQSVSIQYMNFPTLNFTADCVRICVYVYTCNYMPFQIF